MSKKLIKLFKERGDDPARLALWSAIGEWSANKKDEKAMMAVEEAAKELGRKRSRSCKDDHHGACTGDEAAKCECRCHYTRRTSRFRPLRGQGEEAKASRLARGLCPVHGVVMIPDDVKWEKGRPVADLLKCSRKDCSIKVEANRKEGT